MFLFGLHAISIVAGILAGYSLDINYLSDYFWILYILVGNILIIIPWRYFKGDYWISVNPRKVDKVYRLLVFILVPVSLILTAIAIMVSQFAGDNISDFKYNDGNTDFLYYVLPFYARRLYQLSTLFYYYSYVMIPLHFFYLQREDKKKAFVCFILSLCIVLYGFTYFSRSAIIHYILLYAFSYLLVHRTIKRALKLIYRYIFAIISVSMVVYFVVVSFSRFENSTYFDDKISNNSVVQDATRFGMIDYLGQATPNGFVVLQRFNGETMNGMMAIQRINDILQYVRMDFINNDLKVKKRERLLKEYSGSFLAVPAYNIYDFGYIIGSIIFFIYYFIVVVKLRNKRSFPNFCLLTFMSQYAVLSIFYSTLDTVVCLCFLCFPIYLLKFRRG